MSFLKEFEKQTNKIDGVSTSSPVPETWFDIGNHVINKILTNNVDKGFPVGKLIGIAGPSSSGKSFLAGNAAAAAQRSFPDSGVLYIDSENAMDEGVAENMGMDISPNKFIYRGVNTINNCTKVVQNFIKAYKNSGSETPFLIVIDSLDMLLTSSALDNYEKRGENKGDQGQQAKQLKQMLTTFVQDVKNTNIAILCTKQVYVNQDPIAALTEPFIFTESLKFAFSQILMINKLMLKNKSTKEFEGIRLKAFGYKNRFAKPFQKVVVEVPYDTGMDRFNGLLEVAEQLGIVEKNAAWYSFGENKFQLSNFDKYKHEILEKVREKQEESLYEIDDSEYYEIKDGESNKSKLDKKHKSKDNKED